MNSVQLIGRIANDLELRTSNTGIKYVKFTLAVNSGKGKDGNEKTDFIKIGVFNRQAEVLCNYMGKGSKLAVQGSITTGSYTNKDGQKVYTTEVTASHVEFMDSKDTPREEPKQQKFQDVDEDIPW